MEQTKQLVDAIIKGVQEKKGTDITVINLSEIEGSICRYFVICQGNSPQQVEAIADEIELVINGCGTIRIADEIEETARIDAQQKPVRVVGRENAVWVAMDYSDVMVHVFVPDAREYYDLEHLWSDAPMEMIPNLD